MKIEKIVLGPLDTNCYILTDDISGDIAVIDPGYPSDELRLALENRFDKIKYILLTHCHADHILGIDLIKSNSKPIIATHKFEQNRLMHKEYSLYDVSNVYNVPQVPCEIDMPIDEGAVINLGKNDIKVLHTPGHTNGSVCFVTEDVIFSGDTIFKLSAGRTDLPSGSFPDLIKSFEKLFDLCGDYEIMPGHGESTTLKFERKSNPFSRMI